MEIDKYYRIVTEIVYKIVPKNYSVKIIWILQSEPNPAQNNLQVATPPSLQDVAPLVTMVPPVPQILQPASLPNLPVIHHQQQPQVIYLQPVQPTEFIVVSKKKKSERTPDWLFTRPVLQIIAAMKSGFIQKKINVILSLTLSLGFTGMPCFGAPANRQRCIETKNC